MESKLDELKSAAKEPGDRHLLEHLFFCSDAAHLQRLAEEGFPQPPSHPLTNSLTLALQQGIRATGPLYLPGVQICHVLVAKVLTSHCCKVCCFITPCMQQPTFNMPLYTHLKLVRPFSWLLSLSLLALRQVHAESLLQRTKRLLHTD